MKKLRNTLFVLSEDAYRSPPPYPIPDSRRPTPELSDRPCHGVGEAVQRSLEH